MYWLLAFGGAAIETAFCVATTITIGVAAFGTTKSIVPAEEIGGCGRT